AGYGTAVRHDTYCHALANVVADPVQELREYIRRDLLNLALRNTDNHGRNTAVLRTNGQVRLSPLFFFVPMFLDPEGIGRVSRWEDERPGNQPEWAVICEKLKNLLAPLETRTWLASLGEDIKRLPETMRKCHVNDGIIQRLTGWIDEVAAGLVEARPRTWP
ncbi:MAG: HipA domain-containing protein, partial [Deltaproteobacteria bacterium]|nr:HipA domain-containing protein [Deltaproteobacteria bacterium]